MAENENIITNDQEGYDAVIRMIASQVPAGFTEEDYLALDKQLTEAIEAEVLEDEVVQVYNSVRTQIALATHIPMREQLIQAANDVNRIEATPEQLRHCAQAYRDSVVEPVYGATISDMLSEHNYRVADNNNDLLPEQAMIDERFHRDLGFLDQNYLTSSTNSPDSPATGIDAVGNLYTRIVGNSIGKFLDAHADGTLSAEVDELHANTFNWLQSVAGDSIDEFHMLLSLQEAIGIDWIGEHIPEGDEELMTYTTMLSGYTRGLAEKRVAGELTDEDVSVMTAMTLINYSNLMADWQRALYENIPGMAKHQPTQTARNMVQSQLVTAPPAEETSLFEEPTDIPEFTEPIEEVSDLT